jgi:hypothetical protein
MGDAADNHIPAHMRKRASAGNNAKTKLRLSANETNTKNLSNGYVCFIFFVTLDLFWWANQDWYFTRVLYPLFVGGVWVFVKIAEDSI